MNNEKRLALYLLLAFWGLGMAWELDKLHAQLDKQASDIAYLYKDLVGSRAQHTTSAPWGESEMHIVAGGMTVYIDGKPYVPLLTPAPAPPVVRWGDSD